MWLFVNSSNNTKKKISLTNVQKMNITFCTRRRLQVLQGERRGGATQAGGPPGNRPRCHVQRGRQLRDQAVRLRLQRPLLLVRGRPDRGGGGRHQDRVRRPGHEPELRRWR